MPSSPLDGLLLFWLIAVSCLDGVGRKILDFIEYREGNSCWPIFAEAALRPGTGAGAFIECT